jgi:hypothetical protein
LVVVGSAPGSIEPAAIHTWVRQSPLGLAFRIASAWSMVSMSPRHSKCGRSRNPVQSPPHASNPACLPTSPIIGHGCVSANAPGPWNARSIAKP